MLYTEKEKNEIERVRKVFEKHIQQMTAYDLVWSDKVGYVWLAISIDPVYIDAGYIRYCSKVHGKVNAEVEEYVKQKLIAALFKFRFDR